MLLFPWVCPDDGQALAPATSSLVCVACQRAYPLRDGVPCFAAWESLPDRQRHEREHREREVAFAHDRRGAYEREVEREAVVRRLSLTADDAVLDAGCGLGHITQMLLQTGASVCALDFALARVQGLRAAAEQGRLAVAQADLTHLPLPRGSFSTIVCTQVLEHIPGASARQSLLASFYQTLRPGGTLLLTVYNLSEPWRRRGAAAEGLHNTGIYYHCYQPAELRRDLAQFELLELCGIIHLFPHTYRLFPRLGPIARHLDHWGEHHPRLSYKWGHLLLAHARRQ